jgi:hypothetical protein
LPSNKTQKAALTGTDGRGVDASQNALEKLTPKLTPKSTPTAFSDKNCLSSIGNNHNTFKENANNDNYLSCEELDKESNQLATIGIRGNEKPTVGFEPTTTGLQNQSSTVELRWRLSV